MAASDTATAPLTILTFVRDDWEAFALLVERLDAALAEAALEASLVVVDDGSESAPAARLTAPPRSISRIEALVLARNLGHQRAIAVGLCHLLEAGTSGLVVVMDADGEDRPEDLPRLVEEARSAEGDPIVFAARSRRVEGPAFRLGYRCYQVLHWLLTGRGIRVGNFSVLPARRLRALASHPDLWNHYAATVIASRLPTRLVPCPRGPRLAGRSKQSLVGLVVHGLAAISCYREAVVVRLAAFMAAVLAGSLALLGAMALLRLAAPASAPSWGPVAVAVVALLSLQVLGAAGIAALLVLSQRSAATALPLRDSEAFVDRVVVLHG